MGKTRWVWSGGLVLLTALGCAGRGPPGSDDDPLSEEADAGDEPVREDAGGAGPDAALAADAGPDAGGCGPGPVCRPTAGGPHWLVEGETLRATVRCATGLAGPTIRVAGLPAGARYDPWSGSLSWTPGLDQAAVYDLALEAGACDLGTVRVGVADKEDDPANVPIADPLRYPEELGLPVMWVSFSGTPSKLVSLPAQVVYRGRTWSAQLKLHGVTSLDYPKNSYGLKFDRSDPFQEPAYGLDGRDKIRLTTTFDDNSYVRSRLTFALWNRLDAQHIPMKAYNAVLYLNGHYHGLYLVSDDPDKGLLEIAGLSREGNLYKAVSNDANFDLVDQFGQPKLALYQGYEKKEGVPLPPDPHAFDDLDELVHFVASADAESFKVGFPQRARLADFQAWWMLVSFVQGEDNVRKNYLLYRDAALAGPFRYIPWDLSGSFGQSYDTTRQAPRTLEYEWSNRLFARMLAEPSFGLRARYHQVLRGSWAQPDVLALYDGYVAEITRSAERDEAKWGELYRTYQGWSGRTDFRDFHGEAQYVRDWILEHHRLLAARY